MRPKTGSLILRYGSAVVSVVLATGARSLLDPVLGDHHPFVTFFLAVIFTAWYAGLGPALVALALGGAIAAYVFVPPRGSLLVLESEHLVGLALFLFVGLVAAGFSEALQAARRRAEAGAAEASRHREWLRVLLAGVGDAVLATDTHGYVTFLNPAAEVLTGWAQDEAVGRELGDLFELRDDDTGAPADDPVRRVLREGTEDDPGGPRRLVLRDGSSRVVEVSATAIRDEQRRLQGVVLVLRDVTEKRQAEQALRRRADELAESLALLDTLLRNSRVGFAFLDRECRYVRLNEALAAVNGLPVQAHLGRTPWELLPGVGPALEPVFRRVLETGEAVVGREVSGATPAAPGEERHWLVSLYPVRTPDGQVRGIGAVVVDITEQKRAGRASRFLADAGAALAELSDYESTLQAIARMAVPFFADWCAVDLAEPDGSLRRLAVAHADPRQVELAYELQRRYPPDPNAAGGAYYVLRTGQPDLHPELTDEELDRAARDDEHRRLLRALGLKSYLCVPLTASGQTLGVLTFATAESGRRYGEADLVLAEELAHRAGIAVENARLYRELREADRRKNEFLAMLSHELRNPLATVRNALHLLQRPGLNGGDAARAREMLGRQVEQLVRLVDDLLDVSRIVHGRIDLRRERVDLASVVARAVEMARPALDALRHELTVTLPDRPVTLEGDVVRLTQALGNLLHNAAKYTKPGGRVWLTAERDGDEAVIRVRDNGIGIRPEMLDRVFDLFVQSDRAIDRSQGGLGIGLTLVKKLVELHGGTVRAHSDGPGTGCEFVVRLPALPEAAEGRADGPASAAAVPRRRVLVVDDNVDAADSLALLLRLQGQEVRVAHDGPSALAAAGAERPDVIFLDLGMPGMDGYEVCRRLRRLAGLDGVRVVALTGWGQDEDRRRSREAGFDRHLVKPVEPEKLEEVLAGVLPAG